MQNENKKRKEYTPPTMELIDFAFEPVVLYVGSCCDNSDPVMSGVIDD